jgi:AcrR family transcriptional regulator
MAMKSKNVVQEIDHSTEEKIKNAARIVFHKKGYSATRTRDIAEEAGVNLALLNYYFRSKEKLFDLIMAETLEIFFESLASVFNDQDSTLEEKIDLLVEKYLDLLKTQPEIPGFILSEIQKNAKGLVHHMHLRDIVMRSYLFQQIRERMGNSVFSENFMIQNMMNIIGLIVFPFIGRPMLNEIFDLNDARFQAIIEERKKMIPLWFKSMINMQFPIESKLQLKS